MTVKIEALVTSMQLGKRKIAFKANINAAALPISPAQYEGVESYLKKRYPKSDIYISRISEA